MTAAFAVVGGLVSLESIIKAVPEYVPKKYVKADIKAVMNLCEENPERVNAIRLDLYANIYIYLVPDFTMLGAADGRE